LATNIDVYFCDPQSPWLRESNDNTNGLLRQYFPKRSDLSVYTQTQLNRVAQQLNERPRKTLGFETPAERLMLVLHRSLEPATRKRGESAGDLVDRSRFWVLRFRLMVTRDP
jgi:hypothetical protein